MRPRLAAVALAGLLAAACSDAGGTATPATTAAHESTTTATPESPATTGATSSTTVPPPWSVAGAEVHWAAVPTSGTAGAVVTADGMILPVTGGGSDTWTVQTPCSNEATVHGTTLYGANVVLDPGHGGEEPGAVGPTGLVEKDVNFDVAQRVKAMLEQSGATVALTRTADYRVTLATRGLIATSLHPQAFVSIHHNAEPDGPWTGPGSETYYQIASTGSKRLAGLVWEEEHAALSAYDIAWVADTDAGAKYRLSSDGTDYYGILRRTAGVDAALSEAAFISNAPEEQLLATPEFRDVEAAAITRAIIRFLFTDDDGTGYVTPYPRSTTSSGPGGSALGCDDPPLA